MVASEKDNDLRIVILVHQVLINNTGLSCNLIHLLVMASLIPAPITTV